LEKEPSHLEESTSHWDEGTTRLEKAPLLLEELTSHWDEVTMHLEKAPLHIGQWTAFGEGTIAYRTVDIEFGRVHNTFGRDEGEEKPFCIATISLGFTSEEKMPPHST